jgi:Methylamine utilisation protein MauE
LHASAPLLDPAFGYLIVLAISLLFLIAGSHKLRNLALFTEVFVAYCVLPESWARRAALLVPWIELAIAVTLPPYPSRRWAVPAAAGVLIAYASGIAVNLARGRRDLDCGCGPVGNRRLIAAWMVWRNLLFVLSLGVAALPWASRRFDGSDVLTVAGGLAVLVALYAAIDQLLGEVAPKAAALTRMAP